MKGVHELPSHFLPSPTNPCLQTQRPVLPWLLIHLALTLQWAQSETSDGRPADTALRSDKITAKQSNIKAAEDSLQDRILFFEGLNEVNRQPSHGLKFNRQPSKMQSSINRQEVSRYFKSHYFR